MKVDFSHTYKFPVPQLHEFRKGITRALGQSREGSGVLCAHKRTSFTE